METILHVILSVTFWSSILLIGYSYAVYPKLLASLARGKSLPEERFLEDEEFPEVTVLMAVYNEEAVIGETVRSILQSEYPEGKLRFWIGSDGSTDRSHEIIAAYQEKYPELKLHVFSGRNGKIKIINQLAAEVPGDEGGDSAAFVICDANVAWSPLALKNMVRHFKRDGVGIVGARVKDRHTEHDGIGDEEEAYVSGENRTKFNEGVLWGSMIGAFGACYAMRASLFVPVPETFVNDDFFQTMACLEGGHEAIVDQDAEVYEAVSLEIAEEFRRKTRISMGNFQKLTYYQHFLLPWRGPAVISFAFWSHKGIRWFGPQLVMLIFGSAIILSFIDPLYWAALGGILLTGLAAGVDYFISLKPSRRHIKLFRFIRYFYAMNYAVWLGLLAFRRGVLDSAWKPTKRVEHVMPKKKRTETAKT